MKLNTRYLVLLGFLALFSLSLAVESSNEEEKVDQEKVDYAKGSVCGYCEYCKFCKLCDKDCPCETSPSKPNCKMCKYCKFCYLCSGVCDTICQPGGVIDKVSAAIVNALPSHDPEEINKDIKSVDDWMKKNKDEL
ncbi:sarcoplasmic reticulum histidine-rich calcium-binding protein-like [Saccostrea echinata]|uniref:sarcoplasmic reticulum histidine-rich calcium-binding protein-like n=1 Tax=Saccostrea echinata TaxID=191078 RepID=UPI002A838C7C|nr:sarcoplasmic reticulum histidine-rich calcium-binding protein-like [Saccostrea echinata]